MSKLIMLKTISQNLILTKICLTSGNTPPLPVYLHIATCAFSSVNSAFDLLHCDTSFYDFGKPMDSYHI